MKKRREASQVVNKLSEYLKRSKNEAQSTNHILLEILGVALEIRDILAEPDHCNFNEIFFKKTN